MSAIGIIPARYASTRFPGKALAPLGGYPLVHHVYAAAMQASSLSHLIIATESTRVAAELAKIGDRVVLTSKDHRTGTDRVAEAARQFEADLVLNIQGDEPQLRPQLIDALVEFMEGHPQFRMGTIASTHLSAEDRGDPNVVKVVMSGDSARAFYRAAPEDPPPGQIMRHWGLYAYHRDFLYRFASHPQSEDELEHGLEQLRAFDMGEKIGVLVTEFEGQAVDTREDLLKLAQNWSNPDWVEVA